MRPIHLKVRMIDGHRLRRRYPDLIGGSHTLVDKIVPKGEIWIERMKNPKEHKFLLAHECIEHLIMRIHRWPYARAHAVATKLEVALRRGGSPDRLIRRYCTRYLGKKRGSLCAGPITAGYRKI